MLLGSPALKSYRKHIVCITKAAWSFDISTALTTMQTTRSQAFALLWDSLLSHTHARLRRPPANEEKYAKAIREQWMNSTTERGLLQRHTYVNFIIFFVYLLFAFCLHVARCNHCQVFVNWLESIKYEKRRKIKFASLCECDGAQRRWISWPAVSVWYDCVQIKWKNYPTEYGHTFRFLYLSRV